MTPERWRQIDDLLQEALKRPSGQRAAFLDEVCTDDVTRQEINSLVSLHDQVEDFLEVPAFEAAASLLCEGDAEEMVGVRVGPYQIEAQLGAGGMGEVYLAEDTKLDRKVAIKFLPSYLEADELAKRRLVKEAKAVARLDHPNICTIYEVLEEARHSFIVMQYVQGETLACRIRRAPLAMRESLEVAVQVADALAEAHAHGIIHRDIKPQNIMITSRAQVKVLDFGLAKVIQSAGMQAQTQSQFSAPGIVVGTPTYMSPEQARGDSVDARSDLFSLGVVLYECVAGRTPFSGTTPMEICAQIINCDPPRNPPPPSHFNPHIPPELDAVMLKALAKDPAARYESAAAMLQALRATRDGLQAERQVSTKPPPRSLRTSIVESLTARSDLWRRPRVLISVMLAAVIIALLAFFRILPSELATPHRPSAEALHWYNVGTNALRNGTYYDASLALQKATAADDKFPLAHAALAEAWVELGYVDRANQELLRARSLIRDLSPLPRLEGLYLQAITHIVLREFAAAIENYQEIARAAPDVEQAAAYVDLGRAYEKDNEVEKALESYANAARLAPSDVAAYLRLGILYSARQQNLASGLEAFQKAEDIYRVLRNFEGVTEVYYQRGFVFYNLDRLAEARAQLEKALEVAGTTANQYQQSRALSVLSNVSADQGYASQARQQANQAIELARANGLDNQVTGGYIWLGNTCFKLGEYSEAEKYYRQSLELAQRDAEGLNEAWALLSLGSLRAQQGNTDEATHYCQRARIFFERGGYRKWLSMTLTLLGRAYRDQGDHQAARQAFTDLLQQGEQANDLSQVALAHEEIGSLLAIEEQYTEALSHYEESYKINKSLNSLFNLGYSVINCGGMLWQIGRHQEAKSMLQEAYAIARRPDATYQHMLASIHMVDARLELSEWHFQEAKAWCRQALALAGTQYLSTAVEAKYTLGLAQTRSGRPSAGMPLCQDAVAMATTTSDPQLLASALLAAAEAALESGQAQFALKTALQAQQGFARFEQQDSEWRAWLIAARAGRLLGEEAAAHEYALHADARLSSLKQRWGAAAYDGYMDRRDIQYFRNQLDKILKPQLEKENSNG
jgi:serine/threonine protein kinase